MTDAAAVTIPAPHGGPAYAALTRGASRGVVVLHEIFGRQPEIDRVVERFARAGYAAVAPDLFEDRAKVACIREAMGAIHSGRGPFIDRIRRARAWLCDEAGVDAARVGVIGFCMGGGFALASGSGWGAVSTNYGDVPPAAVMQGLGPVIGCYGGRDLLFRRKGAVLKERLGPQGVEVEVHTFPSAGHSFLTDGHHPVAAALTRPLLHVAYDPAVADEGWARIMAFFDRHL